jgi:hypothetical protein
LWQLLMVVDKQGVITSTNLLNYFINVNMIDLLSLLIHALNHTTKKSHIKSTTK